MSNHDTAKPLRIAIAAEHASDARALQILIDRVLVRAVDWLGTSDEDGTQLTHIREWLRLRNGDAYLPTSKVRQVLIEEYGRSRATGLMRGRFSGRAKTCALSFRALAALAPRATHYVWHGDSDHTCEEAPHANGNPPTKLVAYPIPEMEAWYCAGFVPHDANERQRLDEQRRKLGFVPCTHSERLTSTTQDSKKDAKRVLDALTASSQDRKDACIAEEDISVLTRNGQRNGLGDFLMDVCTTLVPIVAGEPCDTASALGVHPNPAI